MIRISQIKLDYRHDRQQLLAQTASQLKVHIDQIIGIKIVKQSIDARKKEKIVYTYTLDVTLKNENIFWKKNKNRQISRPVETNYEFKLSGENKLSNRPVIIGSGPAGLFCGLILARNGYCPLIIERGEDVDSRLKTVNAFWENGDLELSSNVQFGEGGAGTFSDGKLNTLVKDKQGRNKAVLEAFVRAGAPEEILYLNKPHIGTDLLVTVVKNIRREIIDLGGEVRFQALVTDFKIENQQITALEINHTEWIDTQVAVLAIGHSARDTFQTIFDRHLNIEAKPFAVGVRIQHPQSLIDTAQYGSDDLGLPAADYKLTHQAGNGRSVYTFCMCPGGYVVNASSEKGHLAVNGMSYHDRAGHNANSAVIVNVTPDDFSSGHPLAGVDFQREIEKKCYQAGGADFSIPIQRYGDFKKGIISTNLEHVPPQFRGFYQFANLKDCLPPFVCDTLVEGIDAFARKIKGFDMPDAILAGAETRTSSPVRILRDEHFESNIKGIFPCGEGAGYAGGITSAAMDGLKVAEEIGRRYLPLEERKEL